MASLRAEESLRASRRQAAFVCALALGWIGLAAQTAHAAAAWVKGEVRLNVRTGPSNEYRILGELHTGDKVEVLENGTVTVLDCLWTVMEEEFWHNRYASRDLGILEQATRTE
jgi:uncharacterized protein YraI